MHPQIAKLTYSNVIAGDGALRRPRRRRRRRRPAQEQRRPQAAQARRRDRGKIRKEAVTTAKLAPKRCHGRQARRRTRSSAGNIGNGADPTGKLATAR